MSEPPHIASPAGASSARPVSCIICAEQITHSAVSPCNNVTCHLCSFRQRALYNKHTCLVCRTDHSDVIFTAQALEEAKYEAFVAASRPFFSKEHGVHFTDSATKDATLALLEAKCPVCPETFGGFRKLSEHTKTKHGKQYCDICVQHKKSFLFELQLYTPKQLQRHMNGDDDKAARQKSGFTGHPKCKFCPRQRFYSEDEMNVHIRDMHERCYICNQDNFVAADYYKNYDDLFEHFSHAHYVCTVQSCLDKKFVVFREDLDLTAHMLKEHGGLVGSNNRVVVGSSAPKFRSHLSTFGSGSGSGSSSGSSAAEADQLKRLRFNERAKHYLKNDAAKIKAFNDCNNAFKSRRISASDLLTRYNDLFKDNDSSEIALLIYEHVELLPKNTDQRKTLQAVFDRVSNESMGPGSSPAGPANSNAKLFPLLSGSSSSAFRASSWGNSSAARGNHEDLFPTLAKPQKAVSVPKNTPIRYTTVKVGPSKPKPKVNVFQENRTYKPSYLEPKRSGSSSPVASAPAKAISESRFPALEKKPKKPLPPPVKPVEKSPTTWGNGIVQSPAEPSQPNFGGIPITDKRAMKKKRGKN